jgi:hypothetical protein
MASENDKAIGALWVKNGPKGQYMTGDIEIDGKKTKLVCFLNQYKKEEKHPDWRIMESEPRAQAGYGNAPAPVASATLNNPNPEMAPATLPDEHINPEDIPF